MVDPQRFIRRLSDSAIVVAWDVLGLGPEARIYVDRYFRRFGADLIRWYEEYIRGNLSTEELGALIEGLNSQADAFLPALSELQIRNFHRRFNGNLVASLTGYDDEDPGPKAAE